MARRIIQNPAEIIMFQGDQVSIQFTIVDSDENETTVDITGATNITLKAFEFLDDTAPKINLTGTIAGDPLLGILQFDFVPATTSALTPQTYIYRVGMTLGGNPVITHKNQITIRNKFA